MRSVCIWSRITNFSDIIMMKLLLWFVILILINNQEINIYLVLYNAYLANRPRKQEIKLLCSNYKSFLKLNNFYHFVHFFFTEHSKPPSSKKMILDMHSIPFMYKKACLIYKKPIFFFYWRNRNIWLTVS